MFLTRQWLNVALCGASIGVFGLTGCADRPRDVPSTATLTTQGRDKIVYTAERDGTLWVADKDTRKIVYSAHVHRGDRVAVDTERDEIRMNDRVVTNVQLHNNPHRIFFEPGYSSDAAVGASVPAVTVVPADRTAAGIDRPADVPLAATLRATSDQPIELTPDVDGTAWVVTSRDNRVVYTGRVVHGDHLIINPLANALTINGHRVYDRALPRDQYRVYFLASAR